MYESDVEGDGRKKYRKAGGLLLKFVSPGRTGIPDNIGLLPIKNKKHQDIVKKYMKFIEFKKLNKEPSTRQNRVMKQMNDMGYATEVIDNKNWSL